MKIAALLLALIGFSGCGGVLIVEDRAPAAPRVVPAPHRECRDVCRDEAVEIALASARRQHGTAVRLVRIELDGRQWKVRLWTAAGRGYETTIDIRVDRVTGEVLSQKSKTRRSHGHGHEYEHEREHDRDHDRDRDRDRDDDDS